LKIPVHLRVALGALLFALIVYHCFFTGLDQLGFVGPDEPRYASIAREMARTGDWITPRLNAVPWLEKPPLYYWSAAIGFSLFRSPEVAARAPSGVFALLAVLGLMLCAGWLYGPATAFAVGMMLPATVAMLGFARAAATDMPFAASLTLTMCAAAYLLLQNSPRYSRISFAAFGVALALAVLAKGPAAILLAGGSTALWAVVTGNVRRSFRLFHPTATLSFLAVALPWYWLCAARNPEFLRIFFLEHNFERFLTNRYQHQQPFFFFLPILLLAVFPWTLLLTPAFSDGWRLFRRPDWRKSPSIFFLAWVVFPFLFFSASQSKLPGYILPAVPPLVLLLVRTITKDPDPAALPGRPRLLWVALTLAAVGFSLMFRDFFNAGGQSSANLLRMPGLAATLMLLGVSLLIGGLAVAGFSRMHTEIPGAAIAAFVFSFAVGMAANHALKVVDPAVSPRQISLSTRSLAAGAPIAVYNLPRTWQYGAEFYLDSALPEWTPEMRRPVWIIHGATAGGTLPEQMGPSHLYRTYGRAAISRLE
jgi:4-amino-4-deoxy-L-arabinose transferase-like glycosyltransferase